MSPGLAARLVVALLALSAPGSCAADRCSWKGSGLSREPRSRTVEQVHLRCTEGSLEWLYPALALRVVLEPNLSSNQHTIICIKPAHDFQGASIYVERAGKLHLVVSEAKAVGLHHVSCFSTHPPQRVALFLQASPQRDISRRTASFQYEMLSNQSVARPDGQQMALVEDMCRPCDNTELLMAICSSDFAAEVIPRKLHPHISIDIKWIAANLQASKYKIYVCSRKNEPVSAPATHTVVRGAIQKVSHDPENHMSWVDVSVWKVYRQKTSIFRQEEATGEWRGPIKTLLQCKVKEGAGDFLFTGNEHFGEAWLGCAPRFKDFSSVYQAAQERGINPCEFQFS